MNYRRDKVKKIVFTLITISTTILFFACSNPTVSTEVESSNEITTNEPSSEATTDSVETTTEETTTSEPTTEETTTAEPTTQPPETTTKNPEVETETYLPPVSFKGPVGADVFVDHGKTLNVYGDIDPNDERVRKLQEALQGYSKRISLAVWRKDGTKALSYNTQQTYFSACTIKMGYMLNVCKLIDQGVADENTLMAYQEKYYHRGSGVIRKGAYGTEYSLKRLINLALSISDNVAYKMLSAYFGREEYNTYMDQLGCNSIKLSGMWASKANVRDYIKIWNEAYDYFYSDGKMAAHLKESCTNTPFNYGTETLAEGIDYSHKSGDNFGASAVYNDAGIVWHDNAYIYAVFTNSEGTNYDITTVDNVMEIVYDIITE